MRSSFWRDGSPEGLSFWSMRVPVEPDGCLAKVSVALKGTKFSVIQSPCASTWPWAIVLPFASNNMTGADASKYQVPRAVPVTTRGEETVAFLSGAVTSMRLLIVACPEPEAEPDVDVAVAEAEPGCEPPGESEGCCEGLGITKTATAPPIITKNSTTTKISPCLLFICFI